MDDRDSFDGGLAEKVFWASTLVASVMFCVSAVNSIASYASGSIGLFWVFTMAYTFVFNKVLWHFWGPEIEIVL